MNLYEGYNNSLDKINFFVNIRDNREKINLFNSLSDKEKKELIDRISIEELKKFIFSMDKIDRKKIYEYFDRRKLKEYYNSLTDNEKNELLADVDKRYLDLEEDKNKAMDNINRANNSIRTSSNDISKADIVISNKKLEIRNLKSNIKDNKVKLKKVAKEAKKKYKRMLRASRASVLDKIGIISKYRTKKLQDRINEYMEVQKEVEVLGLRDVHLRDQMNKAYSDIEKEKEKKKQARSNIEKNSEVIRLNVQNIGEVNVKLINLSKNEKNILGRKLYGKRVDGRNRVMVTNKLKQKDKKENVNKASQEVVDNKKSNDKVERVTGEVVSTNSKSDTKDKVNGVINNMNAMNELGVNFMPPVPVRVNSNASSKLMDNEIARMNYVQLLIVSSAINYYQNMVMQQLMQQQMQQQYQTQGQGRSRGYVSLMFLLSVILFLISIVFIFF